MNIFKRALTNMKRTPFKSLILFLIIFIVGVLTSGAISVRNAIHVTDLNLRKNMQPIIILAEGRHFSPEAFLDVEDVYDFNVFDVLYELGQLPYVEFFDYSILTFMTSNELSIW